MERLALQIPDEREGLSAHLLTVHSRKQQGALFDICTEEQNSTPSPIRWHFLSKQKAVIQTYTLNPMYTDIMPPKLPNSCWSARCFLAISLFFFFIYLSLYLSFHSLFSNLYSFLSSGLSFVPNPPLLFLSIYIHFPISTPITITTTTIFRTIRVLVARIPRGYCDWLSL